MKTTGFRGLRHKERAVLVLGSYNAVVAEAYYFQQRISDRSISKSEDFLQIGMVALWKFSQKYNPKRNKNFYKSARLRVRGSMLDELRMLDYVPRNMRELMKKVLIRQNELCQQWKRDVTIVEACDDLGIKGQKRLDLEYYLNLSFVDIDTFVGENKNEPSQVMRRNNIPQCGHGIYDGQAFYDEIDRRERDELLQCQVSALPEDEQNIFRLHVLEGVKLVGIARKLGVTKARISQRMKKIQLTLKKELAKKL